MKYQTDDDDVEMTIWEHIGDLRKHVIRALAAILPAAFFCFFFVEQIFGWLRAPLDAAYAERQIEGPAIHFSNLIDPFVAELKISLVFGFLLASPWVFYQIYGFLRPGLRGNEGRYAIPFILASTLCFVGGATFGYFVVFPFACEFLLGIGQSIETEPTIMITDYLSLTTRLLLAFGAVFEIPIVITLLSAMELVTSKGLLSFGRWWAVISAVVAALLTPPDIGTQLLMIIPLVSLYYFSVIIAWLIEKRRARTRVSD